MYKLDSPEKFDKYFQDLSEKQSEQYNHYKEIIQVCTGGGCIACGSLNLRTQLIERLEERGLSNKFLVKGTGCMGPCSKGPVILMKKSGIFYENVQVADIDPIIDEHLLGGKPVEKLLHHRDEDGKPIEKAADIKFFSHQRKIVLRRCGNIDPVNINDYIAVGGYVSLRKTLTQLSPDQVIDEMKTSGLRGRGGAGFPTFMKWNLAKKENADQKYLLCNADEGDPGAFMDRSILEGDPHSVVEGMIIGAYTIGASRGFVYVRAEYPLAVERLGKAMHHLGFKETEKVMIKIPNAKKMLIDGLKYFLEEPQWLPEYEDVASWLEDNKGRGILAYGNCGRGKTLIFSKIFPVLIHSKLNKILRIADFKTINSSPESFMNCKLLYIDDVGIESEANLYGNKRMVLPELVDNAEKKGNLIIISTNLMLNELSEKYGARTLDRLRAITKTILFNGKSLRG